MSAKVRDVCGKILGSVTPDEEEGQRISRLASDVRDRLAGEARKVGLEAEVEVGGSVAKGTWLRGEADVDIFMLLPPSLGRGVLEGECLEVAKRALGEWPWRERYAEHPYLEAFVEGVTVNVVPCYYVKRGAWISAADRSPFHTAYVRSRLVDQDLSGEMRLLKRFMRGVGAYGAEIRVGGFSGYLCELLVINYGSFLGVLEGASTWRRGEVIDVEGLYGGRPEEARVMFDAPLIVVDPVDRNRNVAAAVAEERLAEFVFASRGFLKAPSERFFYPPETAPLEASELVKRLRGRGSDLVLLTFTQGGLVPDVLWGQLYKTLRSVRGLLERHDFRVIRASAWSDEEGLNALIFEVESSVLPSSKRHVGPPALSREAESFLNRHLGAEDTVSGPWVEGGRWVVEKRRVYPDAVHLLRDKLIEGGKGLGVGSRLAGGVRESLEVMVKEEVLGLYASCRGFAVFLTGFLVGRPGWLG